MSVIPITLFFSLLLAGTFVLLFVREQRRRRFAGTERDSLLPLGDEAPRTVASSRDPAHAPDACGCRDGSRPPCAGCLRRRGASTPTSP